MTAWLVFGVVLMLACLLVAPSGRAQEVLRAKGLYQGEGELDEPTMNKTGELQKPGKQPGAQPRAVAIHAKAGVRDRNSGAALSPLVTKGGVYVRSAG